MQLPTSVIHDKQPMSEETEAGIVIANALSRRIERELDGKQRRLRDSLAVGVLALVGGVYLFSVDMALFGGGAILVAVAAFGVGGYSVKQRSDVRITRADKRFWTVHLFPQADGVMLFDGMGSIPTTELQLESIRDQDQLHRVSEKLRHSQDHPIVLPHEENVESVLRNDLSELEQILSQTEQTSIRVPMLNQASPLRRTVETVIPYADDDFTEVDSISVPFREAQEKVQQIENLETLAFEDDVDETFAELKNNSTNILTQITEDQEDMVELLNSSVESVGDVLTTISYNFYCSKCLRDEIYTQVEFKDPNGEVRWYCDTCREHLKSEHLTPKNRIKDELVDEIWDRLWIEKDDEKRGIYEDIEDQKSELEEREFEQKQQIIRNDWNRIKNIRTKIRDLETEATAGLGAIQEIGNVMVKYDRLREDRKNEFQQDVAEAVDRVDEKTKQVLEETRNFEQEQIEAAEKEAEQRAQIHHEEQKRRHRELIAAQDGGLGLRGTLASKIHNQKMSMRRRRIESTTDGGDWGNIDDRTSLSVETRRPVVIDLTTASVRGSVSGIVEADSDEVTVYFEWRDVAARSGWLRNRRSWNKIGESKQATSGPFETEVPDIDPESKYEVRAVVETNDTKITGAVLVYPDDAAVDGKVNVDALLEDISGELSEVSEEIGGEEQ